MNRDRIWRLSPVDLSIADGTKSTMEMLEGLSIAVDSADIGILRQLFDCPNATG